MQDDDDDAVMSEAKRARVDDGPVYVRYVTHTYVCHRVRLTMTVVRHVAPTLNDCCKSTWTGTPLRWCVCDGVLWLC